MKVLRDLSLGSPSKFFREMKRRNQVAIEGAQATIKDLEEFLEQYKIYLAVLQKVQVIFDSEKIE